MVSLIKKFFKCNICETKFTQKGSLKMHISSVHEGKKPFECQLCEYTGSKKGHLKRHIELVHDKKSFKCDICKSNFTQKVA